MEAVHVLVLGMVQGQGRASDFSGTISGMTCLSFPPTSPFSFLVFMLLVFQLLCVIKHTVVYYYVTICMCKK